jgi:hypothetical protein
MEKLTRLTAKESSSEAALDGAYHITIDLNVVADKQITLEKLQKMVSEAGNIEDFYIEKYSKASNHFFNVGDMIELVEEVTCTKPIYLDTSGSLVISDRPVSESVEKVGDFVISLAKGTLAEINNKTAGENAEILFSAETIDIPELERVAYLGVLELPLNILAKAEL